MEATQEKAVSVENRNTQRPVYQTCFETKGFTRATHRSETRITRLRNTNSYRSWKRLVTVLFICILSSSQCCKKLVFIFCSFNNTSQQLQIVHTDRMKNFPSYSDFCLFVFPFMNALCFSPPSAKFVTHCHTNSNIRQLGSGC